MGHPIHRHMSSGQRYDDKQAYNKKLSSKARLHYLENEEHDKGVSRYEEGMSRYEEGMSRQASPLNAAKSAGRSGHPSHMQSGFASGEVSGDEHWRVHQQKRHHLSAPKETEEAPSRKASPLNDFKGGYHKVQHAKGEAHKGTSRKSSPANNVNYGTGYIGEAKYDMKYNAVDDITQGKGKADYGMSRKYCSKK